jgi:N-formylglutamate deformylase
MSDDDFLEALAACTLSESAFDHCQHVRLAYLQLRRKDLYAAMRDTRSLLSHFAASLGRADRYHETITMAFVVAIHARIQEAGDGGGWPGFAAANPDLLDKTFLGRHYGADELGAPRARRYFVLPARAAVP